MYSAYLGYGPLYHNFKANTMSVPIGQESTGECEEYFYTYSP